MDRYAKNIADFMYESYDTNRRISRLKEGMADVAKVVDTELDDIGRDVANLFKTVNALCEYLGVRIEKEPAQPERLVVVKDKK